LLHIFIIPYQPLIKAFSVIGDHLSPSLVQVFVVGLSPTSSYSDYLSSL